MILRVIQSEKEHVRSPYIREADDGVTAIDEIQHEVSQGGFFDFILMDYVMVRKNIVQNKCHASLVIECLRLCCR